jgi:hypothetical protein
MLHMRSVGAHPQLPLAGFGAGFDSPLDEPVSPEPLEEEAFLVPV